MADFDDLQKTLAALTNNFTSQHLRKLNMAAARVLRTNNAQRIRANITPDESPMVPRATPKPFKPKTKARFLYPGSNGTRLVLLSAWTVKGPVIEGLDEKRGGAKRTFLRSKIIRWLPNLRPELVDNSAKEYIEKTRKKKPRKMFNKLPKVTFFKTKATANMFKIGFPAGKTGTIAAAHHYGTSIGRVRLPERQLLGFNKKDEDAILQAYIDGINF